MLARLDEALVLNNPEPQTTSDKLEKVLLAPRLDDRRSLPDSELERDDGLEMSSLRLLVGVSTVALTETGDVLSIDGWTLDGASEA